MYMRICVKVCTSAARFMIEWPYMKRQDHFKTQHHSHAYFYIRECLIISGLLHKFLLLCYLYCCGQEFIKMGSLPILTVPCIGVHSRICIALAYTGFSRKCYHISSKEHSQVSMSFTKRCQMNVFSRKVQKKFEVSMFFVLFYISKIHCMPVICLLTP